MTNEQMLDLLREAREYVESAADDGILPGEGWAILARIDAALAAHDTVKAAPDDIKWEEKESNRRGICPHEADYSDSVFLTAERHWLAQDSWLWRVEYVGEAKTEAEAKVAAIEYAGRLP